MRIRKGSRVEVFSNKEAPYGAWRCAEIVSGNGHTYNVRFYSFQIEHEEAVMEKVPRKIIRPCPPLVDVERWDTGELVEVLDNFSWKAATVREELSGHYYVVRLLGTPEELTFHKVNLRARKSWQDERWVAIGKISGSLKSSTLTGSDVHQKLQPHRNSMPLHEPSVVSARLLKRPSPYNWSECAESCTGNPKKMRSLEKEGQQQKVDAISCRPENRGGKSHVQASLNNHKTGYCQIVRVRSKGFSESVRADDCSDSDVCSVDGSTQQADSCSSDAESSCGLGEEPRWKHSSVGDGARNSCRSELYSYRSTLGELFSSGPLSWEQEASLTDLRLSLNISDDEHLMEVRNLISTGTRSQFC
ncbi:putative ENT domain, Agenet-like domain, Agenet domain, plant type, ENT domain-like superfamily [Arabidopsis thaliana]